MRKSFMKTFVDAQKDYDQLEIYRKWLRDNNVSFQEDEDGEALYFCYQGGNFMIKVPKSDRNWLGLVFPNVYDVVEEKREYVLEILNRINLERKSVKAFLVKNSVWLVMVASIFKEGKRVLNLRDYQYFVCLSKSIIS